MRELDRLATAECGVPSIVLMENAGRGAADVIAEELSLAPSHAFRAVPAPRVCIVCGAGNNAGRTDRQLCTQGLTRKESLGNPPFLAGP